MTLSVISGQTAPKIRSTRPRSLQEAVVVVESQATISIETAVDPDVFPALCALAEPGGADWSEIKAKYGL